MASDIVDSMPLPVFALDRAEFVSRSGLVAAVKFHLSVGSIIQVEDSSRPRAKRFCYEARPSEAAFRVFDAHGRQIGVFADIAALVDHAEAVTGV